VGGHAGIFRAAVAGTPPSPRHSAVSRGAPGLTIIQQVLTENFVLQSAVVQTHDEETRKFLRHSSMICLLSSVVLRHSSMICLLSSVVFRHSLMIYSLVM
jgi:hypothetical protein